MMAPVSQTLPRPPTRSTSRSWFFTAVRLVGMVVLVGLFWRVMAWGELRAALAGAGWSALGWMFVCFAVGHVLNGMAWRTLVVAGGVPVGFSEMILHDLVSVFWSTLLPGGVAGEVVKGVRVAQRWQNAETVGVALLAARLVGATAACALCLVGMSWSSFGPEVRLAVGVLMMLGMGVGIGGLIFIYWGPGIGRELLPRMAPTVARRLFDRIPPGTAPSGRALLRCAGLMVASHAAFSLVFVLAMDAVGVPVSPVDGIMLYVPVMMAQALPLTVGGLGARELTIAGLGATIATAELAGAAAVLVTVAMLILVLIGGLVELVWAVYGRAHRE